MLLYSAVISFCSIVLLHPFVISFCYCHLLSPRYLVSENFRLRPKSRVVVG